MAFSASSRGVDGTAGLDKVGDISDLDLKKQVRKAKVQPADEGIIDGVTHDSIAEFVASQTSPGTRPVENVGFFTKLRRRFRR